MRRWLSVRFTTLHGWLYRLTGGRIGGGWGGRPVVLLTTTGRKSGKRHTTPLIAFERQEELIIVASNNGSDRHPLWWLNLRESPAATVRLRGEELDVTARATQGEERERLWSEIAEASAQYRRYQEKTDREIPVVVLSRVGASS